MSNRRKFSILQAGKGHSNRIVPIDEYYPLGEKATDIVELLARNCKSLNDIQIEYVESILSRRVAMLRSSK